VHYKHQGFKIIVASILTIPLMGCCSLWNKVKETEWPTEWPFKGDNGACCEEVARPLMLEGYENPRVAAKPKPDVPTDQPTCSDIAETLVQQLFC